jgi:hypothetical protein
MKHTLFSVIFLFLAGCSDYVVLTELDLKEALSSCDSFGGLLAVHVHNTTVNSICLNGSSIKSNIGKKSLSSK